MTEFEKWWEESGYNQQPLLGPKQNYQHVFKAAWQAATEAERNRIEKLIDDLDDVSRKGLIVTAQLIKEYIRKP